MPSRFLQKCPSCGTLIHPNHVPLWQSKGFACPVCRECLRLSLHNLTGVWAISLLASAAGVYALSLRGWAFLLVVLCISLPVYFLVYAVATFIFPLPLERLPKE